MRILMTADLHLDDKPDNIYRHHWLVNLKDEIKRQDATWLFILGDLTDKKNGHEAAFVNQVTTELCRLADLVNIVVLMGNHDYENPTQPFFGYLNHISHIHYISKPTTLPELAELNHIFLPHSRTAELDWSLIDFKPIDYVFAHQQFRGAKNEHGFEMDGGVSVDVIPKTTKIIAGDVHVPQRIKHMEYIGAPYSINFNDGDHQRRIMMLDTKKNKLTEIPQNSTRKIVLTVSSIKELEKNLDTVDHEKNIVKVRITCPDPAKWNELKQQVLNAFVDRHILRIHSIEPLLDKKPNGNTGRRQIRKASTDPELLDGYGTRHKIAEPTMKTGRKLISG